jgi:hypothetical protein
MRLAHKHNRCIGIVVWLGVGIVLATIVEPSFVWAKGGGMSPKPPTPFTREELILIDKCRFLARSRGTDSPVFARECDRTYIGPASAASNGAIARSRGGLGSGCCEAANVRFEQTLAPVRLMSALPPKADIADAMRNVRFVPKADMQKYRTAGSSGGKP